MILFLSFLLKYLKVKSLTYIARSQSVRETTQVCNDNPQIIAFLTSKDKIREKIFYPTTKRYCEQVMIE